MTTVEFFTEGESITGFSCKGHSGYAPSGEDIVCAAVTSAIRLCECTVNDVLGLGAKVKVTDDKIAFSLPKEVPSEDANACQAVLAALMLYLSELKDEYPENIEVLEV